LLENPKTFTERQYDRCFQAVTLLSFEKLARDDNLDEFLRLFEELKQGYDLSRRFLPQSPLLPADRVLERRLFAAIAAGDDEEILRCRAFLAPVADWLFNTASGCLPDLDALPVALHLLSFACSPNPGEYRKWFDEISDDHFHFSFDCFTVLRFARYQGKPLFAPENRKFRDKLFSHIHESIRKGMLPENAGKTPEWLDPKDPPDRSSK
jgi:hypothetical protein